MSSDRWLTQEVSGPAWPPAGGRDPAAGTVVAPAVGVPDDGAGLTAGAAGVWFPDGVETQPARPTAVTRRAVSRSAAWKSLEFN